MIKRKPTAKAQIKVRLQETLRSRLEMEAKKHGVSLNQEIVRRLERSLEQELIGQAVSTSARGAVLDATAEFGEKVRELNSRLADLNARLDVRFDDTTAVITGIVSPGKTPKK